MAIFQPTTGYRDPTKALTLKVLEERMKAAQEAQAKAAQMPEIVDPLQGVGQLFSQMGAGMAAGRASRDINAGLQDRANALAGINMDSGPDMQTIARISMSDPELASKMYSEAMAARQANANREDIQAFTSGESDKTRAAEMERLRLQEEFQARESGLQRGSTEGIAARGLTSEESRAAARLAAEKEQSQATIAAQQAAAADRARVEAAQAAEKERADHRGRLDAAGIEMKTPAGIQQAVLNGTITKEEGAQHLADLKALETAEVGKAQAAARGNDPFSDAVANYKAGGYGPVGSPEAKAILQQNLASHGQGGQVIEFDDQGHVLSIRSGGGAGAGAATAQAKSTIQTIEDFRKLAVSGRELKDMTQVMRLAGRTGGPTGPILGPAYGAVDDTLEGITQWLTGEDYSLPGSSGSRALLQRGALTFLQDAFAKTKGSISEAENKLFAQMSPTLSSTPQAREFMLSLAEKLSDRAVERATAAEKWVADPKHNGTLDGFAERWAQYADTHRIIQQNPDTGQLEFTE